MYIYIYIHTYLYIYIYYHMGDDILNALTRVRRVIRGLRQLALLLLQGQRIAIQHNII